MAFTDKVALVTGAASGIGLGVAQMFCARGAAVALADINLPQAAADELAAAGARTLAVQADVSVEADVRRMVAQTVEHFGGLDIVIANAGINGVWAPVEEITEAEYDKTMDVNLKGTFLTIKHSVEPLRARGGGAIVITSSVNGVEMFSNAGASVYGASKAGQVALGKMLACELGHYKIRVNTVCPGFTATNIKENTHGRNRRGISWQIEYHKGRSVLKGDDPAEPRDIAELVVFLCADESRYMTGQTITLDGGEVLLQA